MKNCVVLFVASTCVALNSCTNSAYLKKIKSYLNAADTISKSKYMAENFHSFFISKEEGGKNKSQALASFQNWDGPMHPDIKIINYTFNDSVWIVTFNEQNDFTKPIGFPGWKGTTTFVFNSEGLIQETTYIPDSSNLSYKPYLKPALEWLQANMQDELNEVYRNGKLVQTQVAANKWRELLNKWQSQK